MIGPARAGLCYADVAHADATTTELQTLAHDWRPTFGLDDNQLANLVRHDAVDILVDLSGHTAGNRLRVFLRKPPPVQVAYLGYPNTTGLKAMDYRLTDAVADPEEAKRPATRNASCVCRAAFVVTGRLSWHRRRPHCPPIALAV